MEEISPIKEILYNEIKKIPEKKIHQFLQNNEYSSVIKNLLENIIPKISNIDGENLSLIHISGPTRLRRIGCGGGGV